MNEINYKKCVMCGQIALYIDKKTNEMLCSKCMQIDEEIYKRKNGNIH